jgi:hypothetical protein
MQNHLLLMADEDVAGRMERSGNGDDLKMAAKKWVGWIRDLDHGRLFWGWVLEGGTKLIGRSMKSRTSGCYHTFRWIARS